MAELSEMMTTWVEPQSRPEPTWLPCTSVYTRSWRPSKAGEPTLHLRLMLRPLICVSRVLSSTETLPDVPSERAQTIANIGSCAQS